MAAKRPSKNSSRRAKKSVETPRRAAAKASARRDSPLANIGVPSPYALAQLITRRRIDWNAVSNPRALLEEIFQTPYRDLFDPANGSPLYIGQSVKPDGSVTHGRPQFARSRSKKAGRSVDVTDVRNMAQLAEKLGSSHLADIPVRSVLVGPTGLKVELGETVEARDRRFETIFDPELIDLLFPVQLGYHPEGYSWQDAGRFYNEAAEFLDPVQGAVADCYLIAALSSVAWAMPFVIADRARATGSDNERFTHQIAFHGAGVEQVQVTDRILVDGGGWTPYCRSKEAGEVWPAIYEKAFAKWRLGEVSDYPAIPNIAFGDPSIACAALTGLSDYRNWHTSFTAAQILQLVQNHCSQGRTTTPMVSWTYGSGEAADVAYRDANVVANHAYSVLGWMHRTEYYIDQFNRFDFIPQYVPIDWPIPDPGPLRNQRVATAATGGALDAVSSAALETSNVRVRSKPVDYIVLRNPWGYSEGVGSSVATGDHRALDVDWWRTIPLGVDGVFAMEVNAYHRYFAGTGGAQ